MDMVAFVDDDGECLTGGRLDGGRYWCKVDCPSQQVSTAREPADLGIPDRVPPPAGDLSSRDHPGETSHQAGDEHDDESDRPDDPEGCDHQLTLTTSAPANTI